MDNHDSSKFIEQKLKQLREKQAEEQALSKKRKQMEKEFTEVQTLLNTIKPRKIKKLIRTTGAYILGRRNRKQLYSKTYKKKQAANDLKSYMKNLYNEGFIEEALEDLQQIYKETNNRYLRQAVAWELALWFANKQTENSAFRAIPYVQDAKSLEDEHEALRCMTIIEAECLVTIGEREHAHALLLEQLEQASHPDLYLALANTETPVEKKLHWINQAFQFYNLTPITLKSMQCDYDAIQMEEPTNKIDDSTKISVILPAYNAEQGIQIAIESILNQSWKNLELLIVDDCSLDNTLQVIHDYAKKDERIKVFSTRTNSGPYVARNIALAAATGEFVTVNDADDWSHSDKLRIQAEHLLKHEQVIANTSEQARLTESLQFYRRGNPGNYIFSNMSSLMFRRDIVMEELGYWDPVRFAGDGEFVRRFIRQFGEDALAHVSTGPLSFPRQSDASLTSSSAFGYSGFFMGARKEYVESFTLYHETADTLYYPKEQSERLFKVPAPMLPTYKKGTIEHFDVVMLLDLYDQTKESITLLEKELKKSQALNVKVGIIQKTHYHLAKKTTKHHRLAKQIRALLKQFEARIIVYGEMITCQIAIIRSPKVIQNWSTFTPRLQPVACFVLIDESVNIGYNGKEKIPYNFRQCMQQMMIHFDKKGRWFPLNDDVRKQLETTYAHETRALPIALENWTNESERHEIGRASCRERV